VKYTTSQERVRLLLESARDDTKRYPDGWVDGPSITTPAVGGSEGLRRLRELREDGVEIEVRVKPATRGVALATRQYRLKPKTPLTLM
jgi:hypothetical protein